jgi:hypothetical protein
MPGAPKYLKGNTDEILSPQAYKTNFINLSNHKGEVRDIQFMITKMVIRESLFAPTLSLEMTVLDTYNFFETFQMIGQEEIHLKLTRSEPISDDEYGISQEIELVFYVIDYPLFSKPKSSLQVYTIAGVSPHGFFSPLKKVSYPITGKVTNAEEIQKLFQKEMNTQLYVRGECISTMSGIINYQPPLAAANWLLDMTYDDQGAAFYLHQTLQGDVYLDGTTFMNEQEVYALYEPRDLRVAEKYSYKDYIQQKTSLLAIASELGLSKHFSAMKGAYASKFKYIDISTKSIKEEKFTYYEKNSLTGKPNVSRTKKYPLQGDTTFGLHEAYDSCLSYVPLNSLSFDNSRNYLGLTQSIIGYKLSQTENFNYIGHHITVCGDFYLNAGKKISIRIPKAIDLKESAADESFEGRSTDDIYDQNLSGNYIVTAVEHIFESLYTCVALINKDSPNFDL